ncbi:hypothetical protein PCASD_15517 [Puccinia coronata f. sp. avenae]|uniref:Reverse transcriptase Ty1/copia-type domain-containing protein n=1 Tax=Puccinia coronata f. sp. avenae TaxID=200324 RepID=A0A2N5UC92_9BASI|nr:hypothetical protein PCASD_15517 [Puccinia coronata f. sp. avenae]
MAQPAAPAVPDTSDSSSSLKVAGIPQLSAPDSSSNYLDWSFVVTVHLSSLNLAYLLKPVKLEDRPAKWAKDNADVCSFIARTVHQDNLRLIRSFPTDATAMWESLQSAHIDSTAGGRIYWLRKLVTIRMSTDDVETHIKEMAICAKRLNSLVTSDKPLTVDDIHAATLLGSLPVNWLHCVSSLMNKDSVTSSRIVAALKAESLRRKSRGEEDLSISVSKARAASTSKGRPARDKSLFCTFCRIKGHDLAVCENAACILSEHQHPKGQGSESKRRSDSQKDSSKAEGSRRSSSGCGHQSSQTPAKAGLTTVVELGSNSDDESDHSGSAYAGNPSPRPEPVPPSAPDLRPSILESPPLNVPLGNRFDRRLTASIHAPLNQHRGPASSGPSSPSEASYPDGGGSLPVQVRSPGPQPSAANPAPAASPPSPPAASDPIPSSLPLPPSPPRIPSPPPRSPNKDRWLKAASEEFSSLLGMETWRLVPRPDKRKIIKSKWVFKVKRRPDKTIQKLKARLVAMGYTQVQGLDYDKVFSPTLRMETLCLICTLLAVRKWKGRQVDFKTAFLNGRLDEPIYMEQPVVSVRPYSYFHLEAGKLIAAVTVHVDDLTIVGEPTYVDSLIKSLDALFTIGADEELHHFLSIKITRDIENRLLFMSQCHYIEDLIPRFLPNGPTSVSTPTDSGFKNLRRRQPNEQPSPGPYNQIIGSLLWVAQCTRPDVSFAVNKLSQFLKDPSASHWTAAVRVLNYLVSTKHLRLRLGGSLVCSGYSDADWAEDREDRRSTSAYTFRIGDGAISWKSRKQATVSLLSTEAEYKALSDSCKEGIWLRNILTELCLRPREALPLHFDNEGAKALANNPEHHSRTKHIDARYHLFRNALRIQESRSSMSRHTTC